MKITSKKVKTLAIILVILTLINISSAIICLIPSIANKESTEYTLLEKPYRWYSKGSISNSVWDMEIYDNKLFCGEGDYDENTGPARIWSYDLKKKLWVDGKALPEEEFNRFKIIDGKLMTVGVDPQLTWDLGNYYTYENDEWVLHRNIPGGVHVFDIIKYNDTLFVGLGTDSSTGNPPILASYDKGESFSAIYMYKNGTLLNVSNTNTTHRVYDFLTLNGSLYALYRSGGVEEIYKFEEDRFVYCDSNIDSLSRISFNGILLGSKAEFKNKCFLANGYLYESSDMVEFSKIFNSDSIANNQTFDIYVDNNIMYVLCSSKIHGKYLTSVWRNKTGNSNDYKKLFEFEYDAPPLSLVHNKGNFYIGFGSRLTEKNDHNGDVVLVGKYDYANRIAIAIHRLISLILISYAISFVVLFMFYKRRQTK